MNTYTDKDGKEYVAVDAKHVKDCPDTDTCEGCAFYLSREACAEAPDCSAHLRADNRHIVWQEAV